MGTSGSSAAGSSGTATQTTDNRVREVVLFRRCICAFLRPRGIRRLCLAAPGLQRSISSDSGVWNTALCAFLAPTLRRAEALLAVRPDLAFRCVAVQLTFVAHNANASGFAHKVKPDAASLEDGEIYQRDLARLVEQGRSTERHTDSEWYAKWIPVMQDAAQTPLLHALRLPLSTADLPTYARLPSVFHRDSVPGSYLFGRMTAAGSTEWLSSGAWREHGSSCGTWAAPEHCLGSQVARRVAAQDTMFKRAAILLRPWWRVWLYYDARMGAMEAWSLVQEVTGGSSLQSFWSTMRIGNNLFGGDQIRGEIFRGTWPACVDLAHRVLCRPFRTADGKVHRLLADVQPFVVKDIGST